MASSIDLKHPVVSAVLPLLLEDKTTGRNIIWATDSYAQLGDMYGAEREITQSAAEALAGDVFRTRTDKSAENQKDRTRKHAEVFTPSWICNRMNNACDLMLIGRADAFNAEAGEAWVPTDAPVAFQDDAAWQRYVDARVLEITCGEAPFLASRYDAATGGAIPLKHRIGLLDRKLRVVTERAADPDAFRAWALRAMQSTYGYEFQGDSLLIARVNLLMTYLEYAEAFTGSAPDKKEAARVANIIAWNVWQMDGLKHRPPYTADVEAQLSFALDSLIPGLDPPDPPTAPACRIRDWRKKEVVSFADRRTKRGTEMKFDFVIGNPPYNREAPGESTSDKPVYHEFMDACYTVCDKVELITPARFLFNAGATPKEWNRKMLDDPHLKVLFYETDASKVFQNNTITGGIVVTYRDIDVDGYPIEIFVPFDNLNTIRQKVVRKKEFSCISTIMSGRTPYLFTDLFHAKNPYAAEMLSKGHTYDISSNALEMFPDIFFRSEQPNNDQYFRILGRLNNKRTYCWIKRDYVRERSICSIGNWKVFLPKANGASGMLGEEPARLISKPEIGEPTDVATDTFIVVGAYQTRFEAEALLKYLNSKFARVLLGIMKVTQDNSADKWKYVPLQNFTPASDIDWSLPIPEIDRQLYRKYGLSDEEIAFIESHVKEMA